MRTITFEEIDAGMERLTNMDMAEMEDVYALLQNEQPFLREYIIEHCAEELSGRSEDAGVFISLAMAVWHIMRSAVSEPMKVIDEADIKEQEKKLLEIYSRMNREQAADGPLSAEELLADCNQKPLLAFMLNSLTEPDEGEDSGAEWDGLIFSLVQIIIECLDNAKPLPAGDASNGWNKLHPEV